MLCIRFSYSEFLQQYIAQGVSLDRNYGALIQTRRLGERVRTRAAPQQLFLKAYTIGNTRMTSVSFDDVWANPFSSGGVESRRRRTTSPPASDSESDADSPRTSRPVARNTARSFLANAAQAESEARSTTVDPNPPALASEESRPTPVECKTQEELIRTLRDLQHEVERLRNQNNQKCRSSMLSAAVVGILIVIVLIFCIQAYRQLKASTDYVAWLMETRLNAVPHFRT